MIRCRRWRCSCSPPSQNYTLLAIPFFVLASAFMSTGGVAKRLIRFAIATVGHFRGGLAMASVLACMLFAALSGSSPATVVAIGTIAIAGMRQVGYSKEFAAGIIANAGTLGILIPPSIVMVVYSAATNVSVGRMFLAGVIPGIVAGLMLMGAIYIFARCAGPAGRALARFRRDPGWRQGGRLGPVPDHHHPRRHLWRRLHANRSGRRRRGLFLLRRALHLSRHGPAEGHPLDRRKRQPHGPHRLFKASSMPSRFFFVWMILILLRRQTA